MLLSLKKEIINHVLSLRFAVTFVLMLLLIFASISLTANEYVGRRDQYSARSRSYAKTLDVLLSEDDMWRRHRRVFHWEGPSHAAPVAPMSSIVEGLTIAHPAGMTTTRSGWTNIGASEVRNPLMGLYHVPDFAYVVGVVISLLALLFQFDAICGEKESGMLRLVLSNAVPRHSVLLGKWLGGYVVLIAPFLIATIGVKVIG